MIGLYFKSHVQHHEYYDICNYTYILFFPYLLYVLTVSGVAYLLKIRNVSAYTSVSVFPVDELLEVNVRDYIPNHATAITTVMATVGGLVVGTSDGSVFCFQLGVVDPSAPGMAIFCLVTCFVLPMFPIVE